MKQINIDESSERILDRLVSSGNFKDETQVISASLRLLEDGLEMFREDVACGMEDVQAGRFSNRTVPEIIEAAREQYERDLSRRK